MSFTSRKLSGEKSPRAFHWRKIVSVLLAIGYPFVAWFRRHRQVRAGEQATQKRRSILKRIFLVLLAIFLSMAILAGTVFALFSLRIITPRSVVNVLGSDLPTDANGYTNFLVLGQGDEGHQAADLTDTMMIVSLDPKHTKSAVMISIPRDLYFTKTTKMGQGRVNGFYRDYKWYLHQNQGMEMAAASQEAMKELARELGDTFGVEIHHVLKADFIGFVQVVDELGGLDITVPETIVDTTYPGPNYSYQTFTIYAGPQHLDGETALKYARSRHSTSDFSRAARQQQLLVALAQRAKEKGILTSPSTITNLFKTLSEHTETTLSLRDLIGVAKLAQDIDRSKILSYQINNVSGQGNGASEPGGFLYTPPRENFGGAYVLLPVSLQGDPWIQMRTFVDLVIRHRDAYLSKPTVDVLNAGARSGLARILAGDLIRNGFTINNIANAEIPDLETSVIMARTSTGQTLLPFMTELTGIAAGTPPPELDTANLGHITVLLGKDYSYTPIATLRAPMMKSGTGTSLTEE